MTRPDTPAHRFTLAAMRADVAELLEVKPAAIGYDDDLAACGLDSIRLMALTERWRAAGSEVTFLDLAEATTLREWQPRLHG